MSWSDVPKFEVSHAHIRYNPPLGAESVAISVTDGNPTIHGILTLAGWSEENAGMLNCHFERDETLPPGTVVIAPKEAEER